MSGLTANPPGRVHPVPTVCRPHDAARNAGFDPVGG